MESPKNPNINPQDDSLFSIRDEMNASENTSAQTRRFIGYEGERYGAKLEKISLNDMTALIISSREIQKQPLIEGNTFNGGQLTLEFLEKNNLLPKYEIKLDDGMSLFLPDSVFSVEGVGGRMALVAFMLKNGVRSTNSYYFSHSQGVWRYLPAYLSAGDEVTNLTKGYKDDDSVTLSIEIQRAIAEATQGGTNIRTVENSELAFLGTAWNSDANDLEIRSTPSRYRNEVLESPELIEGTLYHDKTKTKNLVPPEQIQIAPMQQPDFSSRVAAWKMSSTLYVGGIGAEVFLSHDGNLMYMFCSDETGRTWIGAIENRSEITSTGVKKHWVKSGDLSTPAFEYDSEAPGYGEPHPEHMDYVDISKTYLDKIPLIRAYKEHLSRQAPTWELIEEKTSDEAKALQDLLDRKDVPEEQFTAMMLKEGVAISAGAIIAQEKEEQEQRVRAASTDAQKRADAKRQQEADWVTYGVDTGLDPASVEKLKQEKIEAINEATEEAAEAILETELGKENPEITKIVSAMKVLASKENAFPGLAEYRKGKTDEEFDKFLVGFVTVIFKAKNQDKKKRKEMMHEFFNGHKIETAMRKETAELHKLVSALQKTLKNPDATPAQVEKAKVELKEVKAQSKSHREFMENLGHIGFSISIILALAVLGALMLSIYLAEEHILKKLPKVKTPFG